MSSIIQLRRDVASSWTTANTILAQGEVGVETDTIKFKIGDGSTAWNDMSYYAQSNLTHGISIDNGSDVIVAGFKGYFYVPYDCIITSWAIVGDTASGVEATFDIWNAHAATPTDANTITGGNEPSITNSIFTSSTDLTGWTATMSAGDILGYNLDTVTGYKQLQLILNVTTI